ncbi:AraC family transcriptional regulator [Phaeodactylibacter luteus]|uniref:AraC family transcriptional regulator n=2 Tax=Phaeodactylibacter luteus TaxID=1564516 RepID=A0A5C6RMI2_9BACT|nr:AraC family transcriptional regulator [Phaeodactylibacter luteus]
MPLMSTATFRTGSLVCFFLLLFFLGTAQVSRKNFQQVFVQAQQLAHRAPDSSIVIGNQLLEYAQSTVEDSLLAKAYYALGYAHYFSGNSLLSNYYYEQVIGAPYVEQHKAFASSIYNNIGINHEVMDNFDLAIDNYLKSILLEEERGNIRGKYLTWINLGILYQKINGLEQAHRYLNGALEYFEAEQDSTSLALCHQNLGTLYIRKNKKDTAFFYNQLALDYYQEQGLFFNYANTLHNIIIGTLSNEDTELASYYFKKVEPRYGQYKDFPVLRASYHLLKGELLVQQGYPHAARAELDQAITAYDSLEIKQSVIQALEYVLMSFVPESEQDAFNAYFRKYTAYNNAIFSNKVAQNLSRAEVAFGVKLLEKDLALKEAQQTAHRRVIQGLGLFLLLLSGSTYTIFRLWRKQLSQNQNLLRLNKELSLKWRLSTNPEKQKGQDLFLLINRAVAEEKLFKDPNLNLDMLAQRIGTNKRYITDALRIHHGQNFNQFVNEFRIEYAKSLLEANPELNTDSLSEEVGFNSRATFYRAFKQFTGLTPGEYVKAGKS